MLLRMFGNGGGLCSEGDEVSTRLPRFELFSQDDRPYLYVYKHSNEIEEVTVIGLDGVNVECNPEMGLLLGVSYATLPFAYTIVTLPKETVYIHTLYLLKLTRTCGAQSQGVAFMDN